MGFGPHLHGVESELLGMVKDSAETSAGSGFHIQHPLLPFGRDGIGCTESDVYKGYSEKAIKAILCIFTEQG